MTQKIPQNFGFIGPKGDQARAFLGVDAPGPEKSDPGLHFRVCQWEKPDES